MKESSFETAITASNVAKFNTVVADVVFNGIPSVAIPFIAVTTCCTGVIAFIIIVVAVFLVSCTHNV